MESGTSGSKLGGRKLTSCQGWELVFTEKAYFFMEMDAGQEKGEKQLQEWVSGACGVPHSSVCEELS
jgi:hypothetical protein